MSPKTISLMAGVVSALFALGHLLRLVFARESTAQEKLFPCGQAESWCSLPAMSPAKVFVSRGNSSASLPHNKASI